MAMSANIPKPKHDYDQNLGLKMVLCLEEEEIANHVITRCQILIPMFLRLQMGTEGEQLTEQETAIYDRQIRVWGVDAQRRLSKSHVFVSGLKGTTVEFCKNIVLAGVGSLTLNDDRLVTEDLLFANFLIPPDENDFRGKSVAELCCDSLKDFNPMVSVSVEKGALSIFDADFFQKFDVVVVSCCSLLSKKSVNSICHKLPKRVAFYSVECRDSCGEIFVDLQDFSYCKEKNGETIECELRYPSFEEAIAVPWRSLPQRMSKLYYAMRVIERFEALEGRNPGETSVDDLPDVQKLRKELCEAHCLNESQIPERFEALEGRNPGETSVDDLPDVQKLRKELCEAHCLNESQIQIPDSLLRRLIASRSEFPPVCAIIGGILGQEVIKAISGKGDPLKNFFFFDAMDGKGIIEDISNVNS